MKSGRIPSPCALWSVSRRCSFTPSSPSSEVIENRRSSTWLCNSSSRRMPRNAPGRSYLRSIVLSGSLYLGSSHAGRITSWSFARRPSFVGIVMDSAGTGVPFLLPALDDRRSRQKRKSSSSEWPPRTVGEHGRSRQSCRNSAPGSASPRSRATSPRRNVIRLSNTAG
jgi:hypothetical protein